MSNAVVVNANELPESFKDINSHNLYLYVKSYLASMRANTARVKNRSEVSGGGKKPKAQKGSGGARWGSKRSPLFVGGGQILDQLKETTTKKLTRSKRLALKYAINAQADNGSFLFWFFLLIWKN